MIAFWKKYSIWISGALFIVLACCLEWFVIIPLENKIQASTDDIQMRVIDDSLNQARIAKIPEMEKAESAFADNKNNLDIMLNGDNEVDFIKELESLAKETGNKIDLKIEDAKPVAVIGKKDPNDIKSNLPYDSYLSFQINLAGKYSNALDFINKVENMKYYVNIISLNMVRSVDESGNANTATVNSNPGPFSANNNVQGAGTQSQGIPVLKSTLEAVVYLHK